MLIYLFVQVNRHVNDLFEDLRDGLNLISLLEVLSGEHLVSIHTFYIIIFSIKWKHMSFHNKLKE